MTIACQEQKKGYHIRASVSIFWQYLVHRRGIPFNKVKGNSADIISKLNEITQLIMWFEYFD